MNEQISIMQVRRTLEIMRNLVPILNQKELVELMMFNNRVLERYVVENYPDGLPEEVNENEEG